MTRFVAIWSLKRGIIDPPEPLETPQGSARRTWKHTARRQITALCATNVIRR